MNRASFVAPRQPAPFVYRILAVVAAVLVPACGGEDDLQPETASVRSAPAALTSSGTDGTKLATHDEDAASSPEMDAEHRSMLAIARTFLESRNRQLVDAASQSSPPPAVGVSERLSERAELEHAALRVLRARLAELGERYAGSVTDARLIEAREVDGRTLARIEETTRFDYAQVRGDEPPYTAFRVEREFTFLKENGAWILEEVQLLNRDSMPPINEVMVVPAPSSELPASPLVRPSDLLKDSATPTHSGSLPKAAVESASVLPYYSYSAMANYATTWALGRNPAYRSFPNDCTNFISQAVYAGGWAMISGWYRSNSVWWYNSWNQSYTWAGAHNWYWFATGSGRTYVLSNVWYMGLADVLQMDFERDGNINHTMMVTYVTSSERYLSYHTTDTLNRSLSSLIAAWPSAWYYAHRT